MIERESCVTSLKARMCLVGDFQEERSASSQSSGVHTLKRVVCFTIYSLSCPFSSNEHRAIIRV